MIYFTADQHFGHKKIIEYANRPFSSVQEMDQALVDYWNAAVLRDTDQVYVLGDFTLGGFRQAAKYFAQLRGRIFVIPGSHDQNWLQSSRFDQMALRSVGGQLVTVLSPLFTLEVSDYRLGDYDLPIVLSHYAMRVWDRSHYGSVHLYGHLHGQLAGSGRSFDVGVDAVGFAPISLDEVMTRIWIIDNYIANTFPTILRRF